MLLFNEPFTIGPEVLHVTPIIIGDLSDLNSVAVGIFNTTFIPYEKVIYLDVIVQSNTNCSRINLNALEVLI